MNRTNDRAGMTLVEVMIAVVLVAVAATVVYQSIFYSYKTMMRSRMRLEAQGIAFDRIWKMKASSPEVTSTLNWVETTPTNSIFAGAGSVECWILPDPYGEFWEMMVQVWAPQNSPLFSVVDGDGTVLSEYPNPLAELHFIRYKGDH